MSIDCPLVHHHSSAKRNKGHGNTRSVWDAPKVKELPAIKTTLGPSKSIAKQGFFCQKQAPCIDVIDKWMITDKPPPESVIIKQSHQCSCNQSPTMSPHQTMSKDLEDTVTKVVKTIVKKEINKLHKILNTQNVSEKELNGPVGSNYSFKPKLTH